MKITKIIYWSISNKWYMQINNLQEIEISEENAKDLISYYEMEEINMFRWEYMH